jgi:hypothetical protein
MCVFLLGREAMHLLGRAVLCTPLSGSPMARRSAAPYQHITRKVFTDKQIRRAPDCGATRLWHIRFSWLHLLPVHCPTQRNWQRCGGSINFESGTLWTRNVIVSFAAKSLLASKSK